MRIALTILVATVLGVAWVLFTRLPPRKRRETPRPLNPASGPIEALLTAYRSNRYDDVIDQAPAVLAALGTDEASERWRERVELLVGHALFERDRFAEAISHLEAGLVRHSNQRPTGEARFLHCLGYAHQRSGTPDQARVIYSELLADEDLDPAIRDGVLRHIAQLDAPPRQD